MTVNGNGAFAPLLQPTNTVRILTATGWEERLREGTVRYNASDKWWVETEAEVYRVTLIGVLPAGGDWGGGEGGRAVRTACSGRSCSAASFCQFQLWYIEPCTQNTVITQLTPADRGNSLPAHAVSLMEQFAWENTICKVLDFYAICSLGLWIKN